MFIGWFPKYPAMKLISFSNFGTLVLQVVECHHIFHSYN
ncbi:hypothetical protein SAMN04490239_1177 [Rhodococcus koreensis]|uniref:Uncharacterized protein n=1 Tax=Rhodococcus koreensis TaxID=99653 RepID=A0A1H4LAB7_9NOCA|nr:hypothetical protein SAMN04490239_1177 [Rhodococcus koreensis]